MTKSKKTINYEQISPIAVAACSAIVGTLISAFTGATGSDIIQTTCYSFPISVLASCFNDVVLMPKSKFPNIPNHVRFIAPIAGAFWGYNLAN